MTDDQSLSDIALDLMFKALDWADGEGDTAERMLLKALDHLRLPGDPGPSKVVHLQVAGHA